MPFRILHVHDGIRDDIEAPDIVDMALGCDPAFVVRRCTNSDTAFAMAIDWRPDLVLCELLLPGTDGPAILAGLFEHQRTASIPVVFLTAVEQAQELGYLTSLGAAGLIGKQRDPGVLATQVRRHLRAIRLAAAGEGFEQRLRTDAAKLALLREQLRGGPELPKVLEDLQTCAHKLAGAAGIFSFGEVSSAAQILENTVIERRAGRDTPEALTADLDALLECIGHHQAGPLQTQLHA